MPNKEAIFTAALLGTEQQALPAFSAGGKLGECFAQLNQAAGGSGPERSWLHATVMLHLAEKAGKKFEKFREDLCEPCEPEEKRALSAAAAGHLRALLDSQQDLLPEWLSLVAESNKRIPDDCLVGILQYAIPQRHLRPLVLSCVGKRAAWLAQFNPDWDYARAPGALGKPASLDQLQKIFDLGNIEERVWALTEVRHRDPIKGLELVQSSWKTDKPEDRTRFLAVMETGLSMDDEPFLETEAFDDKRKEVRFQARERLLQLPQSRLSARTRKRAFACFSGEKQTESGFLSNIIPFGKKKEQLVAAPPEECDKAMMRDGIGAKSPDSRLGDKAWWLCQIIEQVDPRALLDHLGMSPEQFLEAISKSEWLFAMNRGLSESVVRYRHREFAMLLLQAGRASNPEESFAVLEPADQELIVTKALESRGFLLVQPGSYDNVVVTYLTRIRHTWSPEFSRTMLKTLRTHMTQKNNQIFMDYILRHFAKNMDVSVWTGVQESWASSASYDPSLEKMMTALSFRQEMRDAIFKEN